MLANITRGVGRLLDNIEAAEPGTTAYLSVTISLAATADGSGRVDAQVISSAGSPEFRRTVVQRIAGALDTAAEALPRDDGNDAEVYTTPTVRLSDAGLPVLCVHIYTVIYSSDAAAVETSAGVLA